ncbi:hypothetical protein [Pseudomonas putida]
MTIDKEKLKALAEAANAVTTDVNITMAVGADPAEVKAVQDYLQDAMPKTILALIAEIDQLQRIHMRYSDSACRLGELLSIPEDDQCMPEVETAVSGLVAERDQLRTELGDLVAAVSDLGGKHDEPGWRNLWRARDKARSALYAAMAKEASHG